MSNLPLILSIGANVGIGGLSYLGLRQQNKTARHGIDAEGERARTGRAEEHFRHRQSVYHDYLDALRALGRVMVREPLTPADFLDWRNVYEHRLNAVVLFGPEPVREAAETYHVIVREIGTDGAGHELSDVSAVIQHYWTLQDRMAEQFRKIVGAMRADIMAASAVLHLPGE